MAPIDWALAVSTGIAGVFGLCCLFEGARRLRLYGTNSASGYLVGAGVATCLLLSGYAYWRAEVVDLVMWLVSGAAALAFGALFAREPAQIAEEDTIIEPVLAPPAPAQAPQPAAAPVPAKPAAVAMPAAPLLPPAAPAASPKPSVGINTMPLPKPSVGDDTVPLPKPSVGSDTVPLPKPGIVTTPMAKPSVGEDTVPLPKPAPGAFTTPQKKS